MVNQACIIPDAKPFALKNQGIIFRPSVKLEKKLVGHEAKTAIFIVKSLADGSRCKLHPSPLMIYRVVDTNEVYMRLTPTKSLLFLLPELLDSRKKNIDIAKASSSKYFSLCIQKPRVYYGN